MDNDDNNDSGMSDISAIINLAKLCIGVGILALPSSMYEGGIVFAPIGIGIIAIWNGIACNMILRCKDACKDESYPVGLSSTYSQLSYSATGIIGSVITDMSIILTLLGVCCTYQIAFTDLLSAVPGFSILSKLSLHLLFALFVCPLVMVKNITFLSSFSLSGLICIFISIICIFGFGLELYGKKVLDDHNFLGLNESVFHLHYWPCSMYGLGLAIGVSIFCFGLPSLIFPIEESMKNKSHIGKVIATALLFVWLVYFIVGDGLAILYINDPNGLQENMLKNLPQSSPIASVVRISMALTCLTTYPLTFIPPSTMIEQLIIQNLSFWNLNGRYRYRSIFSNKKDNIEQEEVSISMRLLVRGILIMFTTITARLVPCFGDVIAVIGCFTVSILSFIMPPLLHLKLISYPNYISDISDKTKVSLLMDYIYDALMLGLGLILWIVGTFITVNGIYIRLRLGNSC